MPGTQDAASQVEGNDGFQDLQENPTSQGIQWILHGTKYIRQKSIPLLEMTSTIKMDDEVKRRFDQLQAKILIETGRKLSQQELLELLLREAEKKGERLFQVISQLQMPLSREQRQKLRSLQADFGFDTSAVDEDATIYRD